LLLKFRPAESADFADSADRYTNACTNRFIHLPPLPAALAPFAGLAEAGCLAAAWGSGAVALSAAAGGSASENWTQRQMWKKAAELCGEKVFNDLGLGASAGRGNLEDYLVESGQRVAADGAALALVLVLSSPQRGDRIYHSSAILCSKKQQLLKHNALKLCCNERKISSNQQIIQLKCIRVLRTMNGVVVYIHFLKSC
jgi:hypothetical protein